ncbi:MAG TPA: hypothetical protein VHZ76_03745, partial [Gammaproteobacteria bacterium]|nr:hypothetical protein [Gammaproteobacteria bacterium]
MATTIAKSLEETLKDPYSPEAQKYWRELANCLEREVLLATKEHNQTREFYKNVVSEKDARFRNEMAS